MRSAIAWIEHPLGYRLGIMARPRAGEWLEDEIAAWKADGVDVVVSLLEPHEVEYLDLADEEAVCRAAGLAFHSFPIPDRSTPDPAAARAMAEEINRLGRAGKGVAIHCRAGIGRSALLAATAILLCGSDAAGAFSMIGQARGLRVPDTDAQEEWLAEFRGRVADSGRVGMRKRGGRIGLAAALLLAALPAPAPARAMSFGAAYGPLTACIAGYSFAVAPGGWRTPGRRPAETARP